METQQNLDIRKRLAGEPWAYELLSGSLDESMDKYWLRRVLAMEKLQIKHLNMKLIKDQTRSKGSRLLHSCVNEFIILEL